MRVGLTRVCFAAVWILVVSAVGCGGGWPYWPWARAPLHPAPPPGAWHVVKAGETLESIAQRAGVPVEDLIEVNGFGRGQALRPGQLVFVLAPDRPEEVPPRPSSAPPRRGPGVLGTTERTPTSGGGSRLAWPLAHPRMSSPFGRRWGRNHEGIDLAAPTGTPVFAADDGAVIYADNVLSGYGNMVIVEHSGGLLTAYAHNSVLIVQRGDRVRRGQLIARVGQSGRATSPHLHFEVRVGEVPQDPMSFLPEPPQD